MKKDRHDWRDCIKNYRFHSIFFKNLLMILMVIILPSICMLVISYYSYKQIQKSEEKAYVEGKCSQINKDLERIFSELRNKAILLSNDNDTSLFFLSKSLEEDEFYDAGKILDFISLCKISTEVVDNVYVYAPFAKVVIATEGRFSYEQFWDQTCIDQWSDDGKMYQVTYLERKIAKHQKENICFYYTTPHIAGHKGVVVFHLNPQKLDKVLDYGDSIGLEIKSDDQLIFDSSMKKSGKRQENMSKLMKESSQQIITDRTLEQYGIQIIIYISDEPLNAKLTGVRTAMFVFIIIMLTVSILLVFYISFKIFDPIKEIMNVIQQESGFNQNSILQNKNEINYVISSVYTTMSKNRDIEHELKERISLLKKAQSVALQSQINPHFLNNTLETINWKIIEHMGADNDVSEMINCLSQLLSISLDTSNTIVPLKDEIEYARKYLYIQQKRLGSDFEVLFYVPRELEECKIIKMVLQPIIENAIKYGIKPYGNRGVLKIEATKNENTVLISIKDSGLGMTEEEVESVNKVMKKTEIKESRHIGLSNVNQRIILAFGEEYGVTIASKITMGTEVVIKIPYLM